MKQFLVLGVISAAVFGCAANDDDQPVKPEIGEIGGMCGGIAGFPCNDEEAYCHFEPGVCTNVADAAGTCTKRPDVCISVYRPVCGCDGKTHSNSCKAASHGVSVAYEGECKATE